MTPASKWADIARKAEAERDEALTHLKNLLAVIHSDGGHYVEKHGLDKAVQDACAVWTGLITKAEQTDEALGQVAVLVDALHECLGEMSRNGDSLEVRERAVKVLSNLPAAAKDWMEERDRMRAELEHLNQYGTIVNY